MNIFFRHKLLLPFFLSLFWVLTHWNFWIYGVIVLGWNASVFWIALLHTGVVINERISYKKDWAWLVPLFFLAISFGLFENPWLKTISFFLMPFLVGIFYSFGNIENKWKKVWGLDLFLASFFRFLEPPFLFLDSLKAQIGTVKMNVSVSHFYVLKQVFLGLLIFLVLAAFLVVPLLSEADPAFAALIDSFYEWISTFLEVETIVKILFAIGMTIGLGAVFLSWNKPLEIKEIEGREEKKVDSILASIVLGGILVLYLMFLGLQVKHLFVGSLPFEFIEVEELVKSGFWQLFFLSIINGLLFMFFYKRTGSFAQWILRAFLIASGFLLLSAGWRMVLYLFYYGLSYEKFFALYTVVFALGLFLYMVKASFSVVKKDILKAVAFGFLWGYGSINLLPVEQIIFRANLAFSQHPESKINMSELDMLSADVYGLVKQHEDMLVDPGEDTDERIVGYEAPDWYSDEEVEELFDEHIEYVLFGNKRLWEKWIERREYLKGKRMWYETNVSFVVNMWGVEPETQEVLDAREEEKRIEIAEAVARKKALLEEARKASRAENKADLEETIGMEVDENGVFISE